MPDRDRDGPVSEGSMRKAFSLAQQQAGLKPIKMYNLRHFLRTTLTRRGVAAAVAAAGSVPRDRRGANREVGGGGVVDPAAVAAVAAVAPCKPAAAGAVPRDRRDETQASRRARASLLLSGPARRKRASRTPESRRALVVEGVSARPSFGCSLGAESASGAWWWPAPVARGSPRVHRSFSTAPLSIGPWVLKIASSPWLSTRLKLVCDPTTAKEKCTV